MDPQQEIEYNSMADKLAHPGSGKGRSKKESELNTNRPDPCGDNRKLVEKFKNSEKNRQRKDSNAMTPIYGYVSVYAEHYANANSSQYGLLNMVLPFVTIWSKIYFCSLADRHRAYRSSFVWFLMIALFGYGSYAVLPFFVQLQPKNQGLNYTTWILICIIAAVSTIALSVITCLSDTFAVNSSQKHNTSYGKIRVWGTLGWGASSLLLSFINQSDKLPFLVPGLLMTAVLLAVDVAATALWPYKEEFELEKPETGVICQEIVTSLPDDDATCLNVVKKYPNDYGTRNGSGPPDLPDEQGSPPIEFGSTVVDLSSVKIQWQLFKEVASRRRSIFLYMLIFTLSGALISIQWSYFFLYLQKIYADDFTFISGLAMFVDSMLGELPFFLLSGIIIKFLGRTRTLSFSFISITIRYLLYEYLLPSSSMYFVLLTEVFQGPSFVLFYVVMTEVGNDYSDCDEAITKVIEKGILPNSPENVKKLRQALKATMQSLVNSCYEGLGLGIGSIVGGVVIQYYGFENLWFYSSVISLIVGLATSALALK